MSRRSSFVRSYSRVIQRGVASVSEVQSKSRMSDSVTRSPAIRAVTPRVTSISQSRSWRGVIV
ncbi:hypothetical protein ACTTAL_15580 [Rhodobacter capsulatus]